MRFAGAALVLASALPRDPDRVEKNVASTSPQFAASGDYRVLLSTGPRLKLSRSYRENLEASSRAGSSQAKPDSQ